ncbi:3-deoxy-7-phosphoheptulonate synthase class II [Sorangium sp. So ce321]|uniref:3-deoxy-7-phosphoheptulonate synthase class II n=1 Tax=Sorangium sp. So ce321 TaxID=3133300 RepID=UPI003F633BD3
MLQVPTYPDQAALENVEAQLSSSLLLVPPRKTRRLKNELAGAAEGRAFLLQGGDCAESFDEFSREHVLGTARLLVQMALVLSDGAGVPVVTVGRIAGQFAKPRSAPTEIVDGVELPSYRGDIINGPEFSAEARTPAPERLLRAYHQSAATIELLSAFTQRGRVGLHSVPVQSSGVGLSRPERGPLGELSDGLRKAPAPRSTELFTSHEALLLHYEQALTRKDPVTGDWYDGSAHMLWLGDRTRQVDGAHVEFLRGVANPLGIKVGPRSTPEDTLRLIDQLNPGNEPGRISLIARMGADLVEAKLPPIVRAVQREGKVVTWVCDPMHGNTTLEGQYKTRPFDRIASEVQRFFAVHRALGTYAGGVHLEMAGKDVTECIGGAQPVLPSSLGARYHTACDPRLNRSQSLELASLIAETLRRGRGHSQSRPSARRSPESNRYPVEGPRSSRGRLGPDAESA